MSWPSSPTTPAAVIDALHERGVPEPQATLAADAGMTVLRVAMQRWVSSDEDQDLAEVMRESVDELRAMATGA